MHTSCVYDGTFVVGGVVVHNGHPVCWDAVEIRITSSELLTGVDSMLHHETLFARLWDENSRATHRIKIDSIRRVPLLSCLHSKRGYLCALAILNENAT